MPTLLQTLITSLIGSVLVINGFVMNVDDIIAQTKTSVNGANFHQLATVLELYYSDHNSYPNVSGGEALVDTLESEGYIMNRPLDTNVFNYESKNGGEDYTLALVR